MASRCIGINGEVSAYVLEYLIGRRHGVSRCFVFGLMIPPFVVSYFEEVFLKVILSPAS